MEMYLFFDASNTILERDVFDDDDAAEQHRADQNYNSFELAETYYVEIGERRKYRARVFRNTLDKMNSVWYDTLTEDQKTRLAAWRQEWLNYPKSKQEPTTNVEDIF